MWQSQAPTYYQDTIVVVFMINFDPLKKNFRGHR